jgi:hypothetical protein
MHDTGMTVVSRILVELHALHKRRGAVPTPIMATRTFFAMDILLSLMFITFELFPNT